MMVWPNQGMSLMDIQMNQLPAPVTTSNFPRAVPLSSERATCSAV